MVTYPIYKKKPPSLPKKHIQKKNINKMDLSFHENEEEDWMMAPHLCLTELKSMKTEEEKNAETQEEKKRRRMINKARRAEKINWEFERKTSSTYGWKLRTEKMSEICSICRVKHRRRCNVELPCGHIFGYHCMMQWTKQEGKKTCPQCNAVIVRY